MLIFYVVDDLCWAPDNLRHYIGQSTLTLFYLNKNDNDQATIHFAHVVAWGLREKITKEFFSYKTLNAQVTSSSSNDEESKFGWYCGTCWVMHQFISLNR